jgi:tRNA pseudouridine38-40 synthase
MVRAVVGTMLLVGQKKLSILDFCKIIETKDRSSAGPSVKAKGLFLVNVDYKNEE